MLRIILIAFTICTALACSRKKHTTSTGEASQGNHSTAAVAALSVLPVKIDQAYTWPGRTDQFNCLDAIVKDDLLLMVVQYGGGCEKHEFKATTTGIWAKSIPPIETIYIEHNSHNDMCRALITDTLRFDISNCRMTGRKEVKLHLSGAVDKTVGYQYK